MRQNGKMNSPFFMLELFSPIKSLLAYHTPTLPAPQRSFDMVGINKAAIFVFQFQGRVPPIGRFQIGITNAVYKIRARASS